MFARYASAASSGILMTFSLLFVMQALINTPAGAEVERRVPTVLNWVSEIKDSPIENNDERIRPEDLVESDPLPPRPDRSTDHQTINVPRNVAHVPPTDLPPVFGNVSDGPLVNLVRVGPVYPAAAIAKGIEGYVIVQFDVGTNGLVSNVVVLDSSHRVFNKAAVKAAERFKFKPRVVDGVAIATTGIQNRFRFEMDD